jgi:hypothetical protein
MKLKRSLILLLITLLLASTYIQLVEIKPVEAVAIYFSDDFEDGDATDDWDSSTGTVTASATQKHAGTYSAFVNISAASQYNYLHKDESGQAEISATVWTYFDTLTIPNGGRNTIIKLTSNGAEVFEIQLYNDSGTIEWYMRYGDSTNLYIGDEGSNNPQQDQWQNVTLHMSMDGSGDDYYSLIVDENLIVNQTGTTNYGNEVNDLEVGGQHFSGAGTWDVEYYFDDISYYYDAGGGADETAPSIEAGANWEYSSTAGYGVSTIYAYMSDNVQVDFYWFATNETGSLVNHTAVSVGAPNVNATYTAQNPAYGNTMRVYVYANDTSGNEAGETYTFAMTGYCWSNLDYSTNVIGEQVNLTITGTTAMAADFYIFSWMNNSVPTWYNDTVTDFGAYTSTIYEERTIPSTEALQCQYRYYYNNSLGNWIDTGAQTVAGAVTLSTGITSITESYISFNNPSARNVFNAGGYYYTFMLDASRYINYQSSSDGITWTDKGIISPTPVSSQMTDHWQAYSAGNYLQLAYHDGSWSGYSEITTNSDGYLLVMTPSSGTLTISATINLEDVYGVNLLGGVSSEGTWGRWSFGFSDIDSTYYFAFSMASDFAYPSSAGQWSGFLISTNGLTWGWKTRCRVWGSSYDTDTAMTMTEAPAYSSGFTFVYNGKFSVYDGSSWKVVYQYYYPTGEERQYAPAPAWAGKETFCEADDLHYINFGTSIYTFNSSYIHEVSDWTYVIGDFQIEFGGEEVIETASDIIYTMLYDQYQARYAARISGSWGTASVYVRTNEDMDNIEPEGITLATTTKLFIRPESGSVDLSFVTLSGASGTFAISSLTIDRDCLDGAYSPTTGTGWLFTELRYYTLTMAGSYGDYYPDTLSIRFYDTASNVATFYIDVSANTSSTYTGYTNMCRTGDTTVTYSAGSWASTTQFFLIRNLIDTWYVDVEAWGNDTVGNEYGWTTMATDYFNLYSQGGLEKMTTSGAAGRLTGGDFFNLYCYNNSYATSEIYWKNLVHTKTLLSLSWDVDLDQNQSNPQWIFGMGYYANGEWIDEGIYMTFTLFKDSKLDYGYAYGADYQYANFQLDVYRAKDGTDDFISSQYFMTFYDQELQEVKVWIDLWLNRANASSIFGVRATAYYYPMKNNADWLQRIFTGNDWGVYYENRTERVIFVQLQDVNDDPLYGRDIELIRLWAKVLQNVDATSNKTGSIERIQQFDYTFSSDRQGINTPAFDPPKTPMMPQGGFLGVLASWLTALLETLGPAFSYIWSGIVYVVDSAIEMLTGSSGVFSSFVGLMSGIIDSVVTFMTTLLNNFVSFVTVVTDVVYNLFTYFFGAIYGIIDFLLLSPAFNIITAITSMMGIMIAWLGGTTYVNSLGQTYDFSYLSTMEFGGFTGGIVIFFVIFIVGFFLTFMRCLATMSIGPILEPIMLFTQFIGFVISIIETLIRLIYQTAMIIVQIINTLRNVAPRPFGT